MKTAPPPKKIAALFLRAAIFCLTLVLAPAVRAEILVDQLGRQVDIPARPQRIVSLMPSITEIVFALGAGSRLKGVTLFSNEPPEAAQLPSVGSYARPDLEKIISLKPDLCLAARDGNPKHIVDKLTALNIPVYTIDPRNLTEITDSIILLGQVLGEEKKAQEIATGMADKIDSVAHRAGRESKKPRVFFQIDASPIISAGANTFIDQLITQAGGINLAASATTTYPRYSWEDILLMQPEVVIIASMAGGYGEEELKSAWRQWPQLPAVQNNRLYVVSADLFDRPTPRLVDGLALLADILAPR
ncbi:MAG: cobalamin-binding protein [Deltaproteobacteria bacterium]|nr:cobalamin-binding protein [Deltaproteobacteria bacterium]